MNPKKAIIKAIDFSERVGNRLKRSFLSRAPGGRLLVDLILLPSDIKRAMFTYRDEFGRFPNLFHPQTFNEHIQQEKFIRRKKLYVTWADKIAVRDYVAEKIGQKYIIDLIWIGDDFRNANLDELPKAFIIKTNHGSGTNIIVRDKENFDLATTLEKLDYWMKDDYSAYFAEWQYRWIKPKIIIETLLVDENGNTPADYKFFCFNGAVKFFEVHIDRFADHRRNLYDRNSTLLPFTINYYPNYDGPVVLPKCLGEMIDLAEILANGEKFVRVDFYDFNGPVFSELTLHPAGGLGKFIPDEFDYKMGQFFNNR